MPITANLPPRHRTGPFADLSAYGVWEQAGDLDGLASALRIGADPLQADDIKSIPDAWAQIQVFQQALLEPRHEMHSDVRNQWRGLLALIALQPEFKTVYDLHVAGLKLSDQAGPGRRLRRVLKDLEPTRALIEGPESWDSLGILYFQERTGSGAFAAANPRVPAALLSPMVLVAAGKSRSDLISPNVPWLAHGLTDPLAVTGLSPRHYAILAKFLEDLAVDLDAKVGNAEHPGFAALRRELQQFFLGCRERVKEDYTLAPVDLDLKWPHGLYAALGRTQSLGEAPPDRSDRRLQVRPEFIALAALEGLKGAILIDPDEPEDDTVMVWKNYSLRAARAPTTLARIREEAIAEGWLIVQPSDLFTHDLVRFGEGVSIPAHGRRGFEATLMPLSPLALMLMKPEDLAQHAALAQRGDECVVTLDLPLAGRGPSAKRHRLTKRYGPENVKDEDRPDDLAIWPNFRRQDWEWNFLRFQIDPEYEIQPRFGASAEFIAAEAFGGSASLPDRARRLYEWSSRDDLIPDQRLFDKRMSRLTAPDGSLLMSRLRFAETPRVVGELQRLPRGVEAIFFARRTDGRGSERPAGLCLVALESVSLKPGAPSVVTVDFGTTNTVAYEMHGSTKSLISFQERVVFPIRLTEQEARQKADLATEYQNFFPLKTHETPIPTIARQRDYAGDLSAEIRAVLRSVKVEHGFTDVIFFMPDYKSLGGVYYKQFKKRDLIGNIKWAEDAPTRLLSIRFIRQLMMMISAELVANGYAAEFVEWRFSYPQAFGPDKKGQLKSAIQNAWDELFGETVKAMRDADGQTDPSAPTRENRVELFTESEASANYFMYDEQKGGSDVANKLMLMLDIGGGTTDLALWYDKEMRWRNSFRLAGGDFFTRYLINNKQILDAIGFGEASAVLDADDAEVTASFAELFINAPEFAGNFNTGFPALAMEPQGAALRSCAMAALGGLMHYAGLVLRRLVDEGVIERPDVDNITVAFGGRGSALFRQFNVGDRYETELTQILRMVIAAADPEADAQKGRADSQFSRQPKHEVARGLLINRRGRARPDSVVAPLGEEISFTSSAGEAVTSEAQDDVSRLLGAKRVRDPELTEFNRYLASLRKLTGIGIDIEAHGGEGRRIIQRQVSDALKSALQDLKPEDDPDVQLVEPPFITELRALIQLMSLPIEKRDQCLTVKSR